MRASLILAAALIVGGCATREAAGPPLMNDTQARQFVLANKHALFVDPDSVRDASITRPFATPRSQTTVCLRVNARNRMGGFTGLTDVNIFLYPNGTYETFTITDPNFGCTEPLYPFPELSRPSSRA